MNKLLFIINILLLIVNGLSLILLHDLRIAQDRERYNVWLKPRLELVSKFENQLNKDVDEKDLGDLEKIAKQLYDLEDERYELENGFFSKIAQEMFVICDVIERGEELDLTTINNLIENLKSQINNRLHNFDQDLIYEINTF